MKSLGSRRAVVGVLGSLVVLIISSGVSTTLAEGTTLSPLGVAQPKLLSLVYTSNILPDTGGEPLLTIRTGDSASCRLEVLGRPAVTVTLNETWRMCADGVYRQFVKVGANRANNAVIVSFRFVMRRRGSVAQKKLSINVLGVPGSTVASGATSGGSIQNSQNWSGYVVISRRTLVHEIHGQWTVPVLNCSDVLNSGAAEWIGLGGAHFSNGRLTGDLLQTGVEDDCANGVQRDLAWWELVPTTPNLGSDFKHFLVAPGDSMSADIYRASHGRWVTELQNLTTGEVAWMISGEHWAVGHIGGRFDVQGSTAKVSYRGGYSAEWVVEDYTQINGFPVPFANYGTVSFSGLATSLPSWGLAAGEGTEMVQSSRVLSKPSGIGVDGFSLSYTGP